MSRLRKGLVILLAALAVAALLVITWRMGDTPPPEATGPADMQQGSPMPSTAAPPRTASPPQVSTPSATEAATQPEVAIQPPTATGAPEATTAPPPSTAAATEATTTPGVDDTQAEDGALSCTLIIRCDTLIENIDSLAEEKRQLVPETGVLLEVTASFYQGESVLQVLLREARRAKLHVDYTSTLGYQSAYILGIGNLYQYDCGPLSGWVYAVNGQFPGYGCSLYELAGGDIITFAYTCDLGTDVGGNNE